MNQLLITGRLTKDATINNAGQTKVINFTVATDVGYGDKKHALFVDCARFGDNTKVSEYLTKGTQVLVIGEADLRTWNTPDGKHGANITCRVEKVEFIGGRAQQSEQVQNTQTVSASEPADNDNLPF